MKKSNLSLSVLAVILGLAAAPALGIFPPAQGEARSKRDREGQER